MSSETRLLRERHSEARHDLDGDIDLTPPDGNAAYVVVTQTETTYPTNANRFYACDPADIEGDETEGSPAGFVIQGSPTGAPTLYAYNVGSKIPPSETAVVVHAIGGRWVFRYDGPETP